MKDGCIFRFVVSEWFVLFIRIDDGLVVFNSLFWNSVVWKEIKK